MKLPQSDDEVLILHNPRCSKSRTTLALLEGSGRPFEVRPYLEQPLDAAELREVGRRLGRPATEWVRRKEAAWSEAGLGDDADEAGVIAAVVAHPVLVERPIVLRGERAAIGRPPEDVLPLLEG